MGSLRASQASRLGEVCHAEMTELLEKIRNLKQR